MKIKVEKIVEVSQVLEKINRANFDIKTAYRLNKILNKLLSVNKDFCKFRDQTIIENGTEDEKTHRFSVIPEKRVEVEKIIKDYLEKEVELDIWNIPMSMLDGKIQLAPGEIKILDDFLVNDIEKGE